MLTSIITFCLRNRLLVCVLAAVLVVVGGHSLLRLPVDAFPDTTPIQVQVNTSVPSLNPQEAEQQVTLPIELAKHSASTLGSQVKRQEVELTRHDCLPLSGHVY